MTAVYGAALVLIAAPIVAPFDDIELGIWQPDTWFEGLALVPAGLVLLVVRLGLRGSGRDVPRARPLGHEVTGHPGAFRGAGSRR